MSSKTAFKVLGKIKDRYGFNTKLVLKNDKSDNKKVEELTVPSERVFRISKRPVGPGASKAGAYKNPEYYSYNKYSFSQLEKEMVCFRLPQPSNKPDNKDNRINAKEELENEDECQK